MTNNEEKVFLVICSMREHICFCEKLILAINEDEAKKNLICEKTNSLHDHCCSVKCGAMVNSGLKNFLSTIENKQILYEDGINPINKKERIICPAVWFDCDALRGRKLERQPANISIGAVICGFRHCDCYEIINIISHGGKRDVEEGFLTSGNRFISRKEAKKLAIKAGQCLDDGRVELFSEDLY